MCINGSIELTLKGLVRLCWVQKEDVIGAYLGEVEHLPDGAGDGVEGALPNALSGEPVVSMKWMMELWSVTVWSTEFCFAHGE